jgi:hypothetical protein
MRTMENITATNSAPRLPNQPEERYGYLITHPHFLVADFLNKLVMANWLPTNYEN